MRGILFVVALFFTTLVHAQFTISGRVQDKSDSTRLSNATVSLRGADDSLGRRNVITDSAGSFRFNAVGPGRYQLSISFVGYNAFTQSVQVDSADVELTVGVVRNNSDELAAVIIRSTPPPVTQRGDTLQISASQFKVNPDASSEDLIRKVPGITIENGQVRAQGENVQRVTIDGRELFGDDAIAALRNLPAEVIDKIQVFDRLSDQAQFTGFDDGNTSKSINIVTKVNMRNGQFGRLFAGYGTDKRYQAGGNATFFKDDRRVSLVGNFNNINQQNFSQQDLLGVTSSGNNRGGNNRGGAQRGGGNRGPGGGGPQGGGNYGGGGGNFLVGQQQGINRTNAFGINYSDKWGKRATVTGSYLFNNTLNNTNELSNANYFSGRSGDIRNVLDTTISEARNTNHRVNMRIEWMLDSNNQIIITPNLSFQNNRSMNNIGSLAFFFPEGSAGGIINRNVTNGSRTGNNLNNNILYRHSFPKRGRTFSINLTTGYNQRQGETVVETFTRTTDLSGGVRDTSSNRFADQKNNSLQLSTNLVYTEPVGKNAQLQLNYNPSRTKSEADQQTYAFSATTGKYSDFLNNFSNVFENTTTAHNAGVTYRMGDRDKMFSVGANYQHTNLQSERTFPIRTTVNKNFQNILPNAMFRWALNKRSNVRLFYRTNVNQPSVTQLQDVLDPTNAPVFTLGNPDLNQQYQHTLNARYTFTNTEKGLLVVGNIFYQTASNFIANAIYNSRADTTINNVLIPGGYRLTKPVNLDGYQSLRSFFTFAMPLKFIKSNFNLNGGVQYSKLPGLINGARNETRNLVYTIGTVIASNVSQYVDFTVSYTANINDVKNQLQPSGNDKFFQHTAGVQLNLLSKNGWLMQHDVTNNYFSGLNQSANVNFWLWNVNVGRKFLKGQKGELRLGVFDLLGQNQSIVRNVTESFIEETRNVVLQRYFMLTFTYNLRNFGAVATRGGGGATRGNRGADTRF